MIHLPCRSICFYFQSQFWQEHCKQQLAFWKNRLLIHYRHYDLQTRLEYPLPQSIFIEPLFVTLKDHEAFHNLYKLNNTEVMVVP